MTVLRLTRWLRAKILYVAARVRSILLTMPVPDSSRQPVLTGSMTHFGAGSAMTSFLSPTSWLDDAHRLRPQPTPTSVTPQPLPRSRGIGSRPRIVSCASDAPAPMPSSSASAESTHVAAPASSHTPPTAPTTPPSHATRPASPMQASAESAEPTTEMVEATDQALYRRLMSLKHLVRLGIYNEGFSSTRVPEQYQRSLGLADSSSEE